MIPIWLDLVVLLGTWIFCLVVGFWLGAKWALFRCHHSIVFNYSFPKWDGHYENGQDGR
jgi:hypothetical protein